MPADLIVYAIVAAGLIFWLRSILGERHEDESQRPTSYKAALEKTTRVAGDSPLNEGRRFDPERKITDLAAHPTSTLSIGNKTAENGLLDIAKASRDDFDVIFFLEAAQEAFVLVVESFASGDRDTLKDLLAEDVYTVFSSEIEKREKRGETLQTEVQAIRRVEIVEAYLQGRMAFITVRFTADEVSVTRDEKGEILAGHPDNVRQMRDLWTFGRDIKSRDPRWMVYKTSADLGDDNETVPNSH